MTIVDWCDRIIQWGFAFLFVLVPLVLTPWNYELFEYNKMLVTYGLTGVIVAAWLVKMIAQKELRIAKTPLDIPIILFLSSQLVSSLFSMDPHVSWFGYYSRFNGGMWSIISYILLYYAFVSNLTNWTNWSNWTKVSLATAAFVALYAFLEHYGRSISCLLFTGTFDVTCWVQDVQNRVFATLGQPNWLAAYLVALTPIAMALSLRGSRLWRETRQSHVGNKQEIASSPIESGSRNDRVKFVIWSFIAALFFSVLLFTRSRSGLLGFAVAEVVFWGLLALKTVFHKDSLFSKQFAFPFLILHTLFFLIVFLNGTYIPQIDRYFSLQGWKHRFANVQNNQATKLLSRETTPPSYTAPLLETGGTESGTIRKYVWQGAINAWRSSVKTLLIGTGTETFAFAFFQYRPAGHNLTSEWDFLYNKAHNEYLNYLATTGIFGLGSYLLFIGAFIWWFFSFFCHAGLDPASSSKEKPDSRFRGNDKIIILGFFAGWISVLVTNFFGFSVVIVQLFLFLFPAMIFATTQRPALFVIIPGPSSFGSGPKGLTRIQKFLILLILLVSLVFLVFLSRLWYADTLYAAGYRLGRMGQYRQAQALTARAINLNPGEPLYHDEQGTVLANVAALAAQEQQATVAAALMRQAMAESDRALIVSPKNVNFWKSRTKIYYTFSPLDPQFTVAATQALVRAHELSPNDPKILYNLAILYGRSADNARAIELLTQTIDLKPNYRDAYFALHLFYLEANNKQKAREVLETYLQKVDPNDKDFQERLK